MNITVYTNFSKRKNSTKLPTGGSSLTNVYLKDDCSIINPVFVLQSTSFTYTYIKWDTRYYFVDNIISLSNNHTEYHCSLDPLATYKSAIGSYTAFVERAASSYDIMVNDDLLSAQQDIVSVQHVRAGGILPSGTTGAFIIEVFNKNGIELYACDDLSVWGIILQPSTYTSQSVLEWIDSKISQAFDLDVYIGTVKWVPYPANSLGTATNTLDVGPIGTSTGATLYKVDQKNYKTGSLTLAMPTAYYNDFRLCSPKYTEYDLYLPGCGWVTMDSALLGHAVLNNRQITVSMYLDLVTGDIAYNLEYQNDDGNVGRIATYKGNISVNVPIGKSVSDLTATFSQSIGGAAGAITAGMAGNYAGAAVTAAGTAISVADNILTPKTQITGGSGNKGLLQNDIYIRLAVFSYGSKEYPITVAGRPLYENKQISTLSGFIKCGGASLDSIALGPVKDQINTYLNSGFYYE